jgi:hypothetical protein
LAEPSTGFFSGLAIACNQESFHKHSGIAQISPEAPHLDPLPEGEEDAESQVRAREGACRYYEWLDGFQASGFLASIVADTR